MSKDRIIKIYSGTMWKAEMVKSLLESAGIRSFLKNTALNSYAFDPISAEAVHVMIQASDAGEAGKIVDGFEENNQTQTAI